MLDLHTHSLHSDGLTTASENAELALLAGLAGLALTDHDTVAGWEEMAAACRQRGLRFVPGVELSSEDADRSIHVLGYWVDPANRALVAECDRLSRERLHRTEAMLERLARLGIDLPMEAVLAKASGAVVVRPHIAEALVELGAAPDVPAAFDLFLSEGAPAYVPKHALPPEAAVGLIRGAGGAAVLAHPAANRESEHVPLALLDRLVAAGLAGVEVDHPGHAEEDRARWRTLARERGLLVTGSSDFHGRYEEETIGACTTPPEVVDRLAQRAAAPVAATEGT